jgi:selenocysteine lyase/cysteine desulfurase
MRKANVEKVWPLLPPMPDEKGLARFEWIGTTPEYVNVAAIPALTLHNELGANRKRARLHYLAGVLRASLASAHPGIKFYANATNETLGLTTFELPGVDSSKFQKEIRKDGFLVQAMTGIRSDARIKGIRVSPNVYTPAEHVHRFVTASARIVKQLRG